MNLKNMLIKGAVMLVPVFLMSRTSLKKWNQAESEVGEGDTTVMSKSEIFFIHTF